MTASQQRITLSRIIAVNWYGFRQVIQIDGNGLIAGAFGTGKSALLDLMQYVLLGGDHWKPNRAAAGRGRGRTLVSYCLCDSNTERDSQPHYIRQSGATIAALEFAWPGQDGRRETWGARIEYSSPTSEPKLTWFFIPQRLEWAALAPEGQLLDDDAFRTLIKRQLEGECFYRASQYLEEMATPNHLHFDRAQMNKTMPKALAFEPEDNFEKFIREFLLEPDPLDVREVRQSLGAHREMQDRLARLENECDYLRRIAEKHQACLVSAREAALHAHAAVVLGQAECAEKLAADQKKLARLQERNTADKLEREEAETKLARVSAVIDEVRLEASRDPDSRKLDELERDRIRLKQRIDDLREAQRSAAELLNDRAGRWGNWLRHGEQLRLENLDLAVDGGLLQALRADAPAQAEAALGTLAHRFNEIWSATGALVQPMAEERKSAERKLQDLARELDAIDRKETPGAFPLFTSIRQRFGGSFSRAPEQLCRLVEVKPAEERWWPALEAMLGRNRFAIVVAGDDYPAALDLLRRITPGRESELLVHPAEARALDRKAKPGSLATKLEVADDVARAFINHLLGDIICLDTVEELDRTEAGRAITPEGIYKQAPTRRRLRDDTERPFTLGRQGLERMRRERQRQQVETRARRDLLDQQIKDIQAWLDWGKQAGLGDARLPDRSAELPQLPSLEREHGTVIETIKLIATPERAARIKKLQELEQEKTSLDRRLAVLVQAGDKFSQESRQLAEQIESAQNALRDAGEAVFAHRIRMPSGILDAQVAEFVEPWLNRREPWAARIQEARDRAAEAEKETALRRLERNQLRRDLAEARDASGAYLHAHYRFEIDPDEEANDRWNVRLQLLTAHELARHRQLAADKKKEWEERLKAQVLDKLNDRLRKAELDIQQLRRQLDRDVGRYRYRIKHTRDPAMAAVWTLLDTGFEPTDELMAGIKNEEIERAKDELMRAVEAADQNQLDERAVRLLDYRFYNRYDVIMEPVGQPSGASISLTRSIGKMSGGENQAPFFICMLAAFNRVYDVGSHRLRQNLSLVIMDEAFSKLSGDGIQDCLELARNFQLQLFMAVPIDRLGVMHAYAETTILCRKEEVRGADGYVSRIDNIPIRLTPAQVRDAVE